MDCTHATSPSPWELIFSMVYGEVERGEMGEEMPGELLETNKE